MSWLRRRMMANAGGGLPYDAEVAYIEGTGTQKIEIPVSVIGGDDFAVGIRLYCTNTTKDGYLFGSTTSRAFFSQKFSYDDSSNMLTLASTIGGNATKGGSLISLGEWHDYELSTSGKTVDGIFTSLPRTITSFSSLFLMGYASSNGYPYRLSSCYINHNGVRIYDMIAVRIGTAGYMYDTVSGELFGNVGSGTFILGPDI